MIIEYHPDGPRPGLIFHVIAVAAPGALERSLAAGRAAIEVRSRPRLKGGRRFRPAENGYVDGGKLKRRPTLPIAVDKLTITADDVDAATITGLPDPCVVTIDGEPHEVTGGTLTITSPMPAVYRLRVDVWPAMPWEAEIKAE